MALSPTKQMRNCRKCGQPFTPTDDEVVCHTPCKEGTPRTRKLRKLLTNIDKSPIHYNVFIELASSRLLLTESNTWPLLPFKTTAEEHDAILKLLSLTEAKYTEIYLDLKPYITRLLKQTLDKELRPWKPLQPKPLQPKPLQK